MDKESDHEMWGLLCIYIDIGTITERFFYYFAFASASTVAKQQKGHSISTSAALSFGNCVDVIDLVVE